MKMYTYLVTIETTEFGAVEDEFDVHAESRSDALEKAREQVAELYAGRIVKIEEIEAGGGIGTFQVYR